MLDAVVQAANVGSKETGVSKKIQVWILGYAGAADLNTKEVEAEVFGHLWQKSLGISSGVGRLLVGLSMIGEIAGVAP